MLKVPSLTGEVPRRGGANLVWGSAVNGHWRQQREGSRVEPQTKIFVVHFACQYKRQNMFKVGTLQLKLLQNSKK